MAKSPDYQGLRTYRPWRQGLPRSALSTGVNLLAAALGEQVENCEDQYSMAAAMAEQGKQLEEQ